MISEKLYENQQKNYISDIFWNFKNRLQITHAATYIPFFYLFSTIHPYLSLLFSHLVFVFSPSFF